jgi:hypothetical protein
MSSKNKRILPIEVWEKIAMEASLLMHRSVDIVGPYTTRYCITIHGRADGVNSRLRAILLKLVEKYKGKS